MLVYGALIPLVEEIQLGNSHFVFNKDLALDQQLNILFSSALQNFNRLKYAVVTISYADGLCPVLLARKTQPIDQVSGEGSW